MEQTIKIGDVEIKLKSTAASVLQYKSVFGRDGVQDLFKLTQGFYLDEKGDIGFDFGGDMDFNICFNFLWLFAKTADPEIPEIEEWLESFDIPPLTFVTEGIPQIMDLLISTTTPSVTEKNAPKASPAKNQKK